MKVPMKPTLSRGALPFTATAAQVRSHLLALQADRSRLLTFAAAARALAAPSAAREILDRALACAADGDRQARRSA
jgi:UDP-N-acetylglucosamine:LPS N-acetylglucosamine transferase